jgi:hypothetical protein
MIVGPGRYANLKKNVLSTESVVKIWIRPTPHAEPAGGVPPVPVMTRAPRL